MSLFEGTNTRASKDLLAKIHTTPGFPFETLSASHGLPAGADSPILRDDYDAFLTWRQEWLYEEVRPVTGVTVAADLEANDQHLE